MSAMQRFVGGAARAATLLTLTSFAAGCLAAAANPNSPAPATGASASAREAASRAAYQPVEYRNAGKVGPSIVVLEGDIKSNNVSFTDKVTANAIADYAELELSKANFKVLERSDLGALKREFQVAYLAGDPDTARRLLGKGKFKSTRWILRFDVLKAEPVAAAESGFNGATLGILAGSLIGGRAGVATGVGIGSVQSGEAARVWLVGLRYTVIDARTTEQVATGYLEQEMEIGSTGSSFLGFSKSQQGGLTLDSMSQRLVQASVAEIDAKYK